MIVSGPNGSATRHTGPDCEPLPPKLHAARPLLLRENTGTGQQFVVLSISLPHPDPTHACVRAREGSHACFRIVLRKPAGFIGPYLSV
jgi:hypothetical protein